jgi:hypothetical protein
LYKTLFVDNEIDGPAADRDSLDDREWVIQARHIVHLQLVVTIVSVLVGQHERWGYGHVLQTGLLGMFFERVVGLLLGSALMFPLLVFVLLRNDEPWERWAWLAALLSLVMSWVQIMAILPLAT